jgi:hypothetical protein
MTKIVENWHTPESICASCGTKLDGASGLSARPKPGDISICLYCGHIQAFGWDLKLRDLTDEEMHAIAGNKQVIAAEKICAQFRKEHPKSIKGKRNGNIPSS